MSSVTRQAFGAGVRGRRASGATAVLEYVADLADQAGVAVQTRAVVGVPAPCILEQANAWAAELIVMGGAGRGFRGQPDMGSAVRQVLEFAQVPVMVALSG